MTKKKQDIQRYIYKRITILYNTRLLFLVTIQSNCYLDTQKKHKKIKYYYYY